MNFVFLSASVERLHGVSARDAIENPALLYEQILEEDRIAWTKAELESLRTMSIFDTLLRIRHPSGELRWLLLAPAGAVSRVRRR